MEGTTCLCLTTYSVPQKKGSRRIRRTVTSKSNTRRHNLGHNLFLTHRQENSKYFPLTSINTLPNEVLLEVFDQYRSVTAGKRTGSQGWWYTLVHICRRWRQLVFASSVRLNLQLRCTFGTPVDDMICHSPPFPLVLDYGPRILKTWTGEDELGLLFALQHHLPRATEIVLSAPDSTLSKLTKSMTEAAPRLETLILHSQTLEIVLPKQFLEGGGHGAPQLRHLILTGVALSPLQPLLSSSATSLVSLVLERIPSSAYFSPDTLITQMRTMPHLQILSIGFLSAVPRPGFRGERALPPGNNAAARTELPALTQLIYRGVSAYIEALLSQIRSPRLADLDIAFFHQLTHDIPRTGAFLRDLDSTTRAARIDFDFAHPSSAAAHIALSAPTSSPDITLSVSCSRFDFQVAAAAQLCAGGLSIMLEHTEELVLAFHHGSAAVAAEEEDVDTRLWRGILAPFRHVVTLRVHVALVADVERALREDQLMLLPELRELVLLLDDDGSDEKALESATAAFGTFVDERERAGRSVKIHSQDLSRLAESESGEPTRIRLLLLEQRH